MRKVGYTACLFRLAKGPCSCPPAETPLRLAEQLDPVLCPVKVGIQIAKLALTRGAIWVEIS